MGDHPLILITDMIFLLVPAPLRAHPDEAHLLRPVVITVKGVM